MSRLVKNSGLRLAGVLGQICRDVETGNLPVELLERVVENPWGLLRPGEVFERQFGELIPKNVNVDSVRVPRDVCGCIMDGVRNDDRYWTSGPYFGPKNLLVDQLDGGPFLPSTGRYDHFLDGDGQVRLLSGATVATKLLSRNPFIGYNEETESIVTDDGIKPFRPDYGTPKGALLSSQDGSLIVLTEYGGVYRHNVLASWTALGSFSMRPDQAVHAVAESSDTVAVVFRLGEGDDATYIFRVLRYGKLVWQSAGAHHYISAPIVLPNRVVFLRIDDQLVVGFPNGKVPLAIGAIVSDPVRMEIENGSAIIAKVRALCEHGTMIVNEFGGAETKLHAAPIAVHEPYVLFQEFGGIVKVAEYLGNGTMRPVMEFSGSVEKFQVIEGGFCAVGLDMLHGKLKRTLVVMERNEAGRHEFVGMSGPVELSEEYDVDLKSLIVNERLSETFVIARKRGDVARQWCVLGKRGRSMQEVGKSAHAIFQLRIDGPLLRWYRRDGREIVDARMYIGE